MKILYLAHRIPYPPNKGDKIRSFHEVTTLARKHDVHLVAFCDQSSDFRYAEALRDYCKSVTLIPLLPKMQKLKAGGAMLRGKSWTLGYFASGDMHRAVQQKFRENDFDMIFVYS